MDNQELSPLSGLTIPPRVNLAHLPTPIEKLERLSGQLQGPSIYIKRDDYTGVELSGNKIRKLEFVLAAAMAAGATAVITVGGIHSNHCRITAIAARKLGLTPILVLAGSEPARLEGNLFLNKLVGAKIFYASEAEFLHPEEKLEEAQSWARAQGLNPFVIPLGASTSLGMWGYITCLQEIVQQSREMGIDFDRIVCAVGSCGTLAGLLAGKKIFGVNTAIIGVNVVEKVTPARERIQGMLASFEQEHNCSLGLSPDDLRIWDDYIGPGYGAVYPELTAFIRDTARREGLVLDPVYTGKAMYGLVDLLKTGQLPASGNILFLHTGGLFGLFPKGEAFTGE